MSHLVNARGISLFSNGIYAGVGLTLAAVTIPSLKECKDPLPVFTRSVDNAHILTLSSVLVSSGCHLYIYYKTKNPRALWCGVASFVGLPYTVAFLLPINNQLTVLQEKSTTDDSFKINDLITQWGHRQWFKVLVGNAAFIFNIFFYS
ncbi:uncharacterized protein BX664DRAFT_320394 [Halteromyces radiatus]|uniref:uncharacterized protein n=1 Tax=Halteromyces radiatus TaxID=101107 RepID=UPI00221E867C|nr:uncharacterized protein BX664DRAFT_320394 [Halteromyces radiatus]KAI8099104.1 hypothetical protein BX664DRAFT_320394 [Halteromyces radiatus]